MSNFEYLDFKTVTITSFASMHLDFSTVKGGIFLFSCLKGKVGLFRRVGLTLFDVLLLVSPTNVSMNDWK